MLLSLLVGTALATGIRHTEVPCPLDGSVVRQFHKVSSNSLGGFDSDMATYSTRGQFRTHAISTCPVDLFSVYGQDLDLPLTEADKGAIASALGNARQQLRSSTDPEVWERYGLAATVYRSLGRHPMDIARIYLEASWTARDEAVGVYVGGLNGPEGARMILEAGAAELKKNLSVQNRKIVLHNMARVAHRAGYGDLRDRYLQDYDNAGSKSDVEHKAIARFREVAHEIEPRYQHLAITELRGAVQQGGLPAGDEALAHYLLADLLRRVGKKREAAQHYQRVQTASEAAPNLVSMASFFLAELGD